MPIRILLVDDHEVVRAGLRALLRRAPDLEVVGEAGTMAQAIAEAARLCPDVALLDLRLPDGSGIEACREIRSEHPEIKVLMVTAYADEQAVRATVLAGAAGYLLKDIRHEALVRAIRDAAADRPVLDSASAARAVRRIERVEALTPQERRIVSLVVDGCTNKEIAATLSLSEKTVKNYLSNAFQKLNVSRRSQVAAMYVQKLGEGGQGD